MFIEFNIMFIKGIFIDFLPKYIEKLFPGRSGADEVTLIGI